jgi:calcium channel MID1
MSVPNEHHLELRKRQASASDRSIYISANTCSQPTWNWTGTQDVPPPQLTLYVSTSPGARALGPDAGNTSQTVYPFVNGFVNASVDLASGDWHMAVSAPALPDGFVGDWNYQLAVSIDDYYHAAEMLDPFLFQVDTDIDSALLVTDNLTQADSSAPLFQEWLNLAAPFVLFASNANLTGITGLEASFCGLQTFVQTNQQFQAKQSDMAGNETRVQMGMVTRGLGHKPKEQFYIGGLNASSNYLAYLAMEGNSTAAGDGVVGGGGKVWARVPFTTKSDGNCQLLFNLTFCDEVAYAVPANPANPAVSSFEALQSFYENYTTTWYTPFNYTLAQIPCNTTSDAQYSLAKNCTDCARAYKEWLCAVSIPRCEDFSNPADYLHMRNVGQNFYNNASMLDASLLTSNYVAMTKAPKLDGSNAYDQTYISSFATNRSRNPSIDDVIRPGPYKEVLPCEDLCFSLMQSCPASMQFACPYPGRGLEASYGKRSASGLTCSYLGAVYYLNDAPPMLSSVPSAIVVAALAALATMYAC